LALAASLLALGGRAGVWDDLLEGRLAAGKLEIPLYGPQDHTPYAVLRTGRVRTEYERRGLFRIGVLPRVIVEGGTLELRDGDRAAAALVRLGKSVPRELAAPIPIEVRRFAVRAGTSGLLLIEAATLRVDQSGVKLTRVGWRRGDGTRSTLGQARMAIGADGTLRVGRPPEWHRLDLRQTNWTRLAHADMSPTSKGSP
jgi:hypothetical protein